MTANDRQRELPLFPLHSVLLPGVALPLHVFEERYRAMVGRCVERGEPFGVVLIRSGREVGGIMPRLARVGTTAQIRQASRYADGRMDIVTVGGSRFRLEDLHETHQPYLVGTVALLDEPLGDDEEAAELAHRVGRRFLRYLELLQPALASGDGPEIEVEIEVEAPDDALEREEPVTLEIRGVADAVHAASLERTIDAASLDEDERRDLLMAAARRLTATSGATELSYLIGGLIQVELSYRQELLEAPDTVRRLSRLHSLLGRELQLLRGHLKPLVLDPRMNVLRLN